MPIKMHQSFLAFIVFNASLLAQADTSGPLSQKDVDSVAQQVETAFVAAYNGADVKAIGALYADDARVLTEAGVILAGRDDIEKSLNAAFSAPDRKVKIENTPKSSISISKDVIVVQGTSRMIVNESSQSPSDFLYTRVLTRHGGQWLIAAAEYARPNPWLVTLPPTLVGQTGSLPPLTFTNVGPIPLRITKLILGGRAAGDFSQTNTCTIPVPPSGTCLLNITFQPKLAGTRTARIWFVDDAGTGIHEIRLSGVGKQKAPADDGLIR